MLTCVPFINSFSLLISSSVIRNYIYSGYCHGKPLFISEETIPFSYSSPAPRRPSRMSLDKSNATAAGPLDCVIQSRPAAFIDWLTKSSYTCTRSLIQSLTVNWSQRCAQDKHWCVATYRQTPQEVKFKTFASSSIHLSASAIYNTIAVFLFLHLHTRLLGSLRRYGA